MFEYEIGGKTYVQKKLVFGQVKQLTNFIQQIEIPENINAQSIASMLGDRLPQVLAIVLTEKGKSPRDKDIQKFASEIEFEIEAETMIKVIEDFFLITPVVSVLEKLSGVMEKVAEGISKTAGLKKSALSSPEETSPKEMKSSGNTPLKRASRTLNTKAVN